ncbi:MAG: deoxyribose-phosphate aldolase [Haloarculaceae archaeon]
MSPDPVDGPGDVPPDVPDRIEHTVLGPRTTWDDVSEVLDAAIREGMRACVPPCHLPDAVDYALSLDVATVLAFPHGQATTETKAAAARQAYEVGAAEIDLVANAGLLASGDEEAYETDLAETIAAVPVPVKVIVEAPLLEEAELRRACERAIAADAAFLKTATGFADGGATVEDVATMSDYGPVKASGGIGSWEEAGAMFRAGADRIGASSGDVIVAEYREAAGSRGSGAGQ